MSKNYPFFITSTLLFAAIGAFFMHFGMNTVSEVLFYTVAVIYLVSGVLKLGGKLKAMGVMLLMSILALAVSNMLTTHIGLSLVTEVAIGLLVFVFLLNCFYDDSKWGLGKELSSMIVLAVTSLGHLISTITDGREYRAVQNQSEVKPIRMNKKIWISLLIMLPVLAVVMALLITADMLFKNLFVNFFESIDFMTVPLYIVEFLILVILGYALLSACDRHYVSETIKEVAKKDSFYAYLTCGALVLVYLAFSLVQVFGLFLQKMTLPEGVSYAEYARQGFFQLLAVCIINLVLVLVALTFFENTGLLKLLLSMICVTTYILILSSALRMFMYVEAYDLSILRILVFWALMVLTMIFTGVLVRIFWRSFPMFRYALIIVTICYIALAYLRPAAVVAGYNLSSEATMSEETDCDELYLFTLGSDAWNIMLKDDAVSEDIKEQILERYDFLYAEKDGLLYYNRSVDRVKKLTEK